MSTPRHRLAGPCVGRTPYRLTRRMVLQCGNEPVLWGEEVDATGGTGSGKASDGGPGGMLSRSR